MNLGFGIADGVANISAEEKLSEKIVFSIEQGLIGVVPAKGDIFGAGFNPDAIIDAPYQFDFYHGGGLDMTFLGMAQVVQNGNVNVSIFGENLPGCGGYCISKAGVGMSTKLWAVRLGEFNIPVYEIRPGIIKTDMTAPVTEK